MKYRTVSEILQTVFLPLYWDQLLVTIATFKNGHSSSFCVPLDKESRTGLDGHDRAVDKPEASNFPLSVTLLQWLWECLRTVSVDNRCGSFSLSMQTLRFTND